MAKTKEELMREKMQKQNQATPSAFELGSKPLVNTRNPEVVEVKSEPAVKEPQPKEKKTKRVQLLTYPSLIARMDSYAERKGVTRVDVFESAVTAFLDEFDR